MNQYSDAVRQIKTAILQSQAKALASVNQEQLALYYGIGRYISQNSRSGFWGKDAIETISRQLSAEMPGLRGFSPRNLRNMRMFYEQWQLLDSNLAVATAKLGGKEIYPTISLTLSQTRNKLFVPSRCSKTHTFWILSTLNNWVRGKRTLMSVSLKTRLSIICVISS